ncbi:MAG TPA: hypothetical protein VFZ25_08625 [Chloroflexota bacterium]|nr:hypothetical protein [Chloroflexota bacterium]
MRSSQVVRRRGIGIVGGEAGMLVALLVAAGLGALRHQPFDQPIRLAASLLMGRAALIGGDGATLILGALVLAVLGALAGVWFAFLCDWFPGLAQTPDTLVLAGATYAAFLWLIGFYLFGFLLWPWLPQTDPVAYALAALAGGATLGSLFALAGVQRPSRLD